MMDNKDTEWLANRKSCQEEQDRANRKNRKTQEELSKQVDTGYLIWEHSRIA